MGRSSKIRHRRRRRLARAANQELARAIGRVLHDLATPRRYPLGFTPTIVPKDSYVIVNPCSGSSD